MWAWRSYGASIGRPLGCVQLLHHSAIPQIYFHPPSRGGGGVKLLGKGFYDGLEPELRRYSPDLFPSARERHPRLRGKEIRLGPICV